MTTIASENNLYVLWESSTGMQGNENIGNYTLFFKKSSDGGQTFGPPIPLYSTTRLPCSLSSQMVIGGNGRGGGDDNNAPPATTTSPASAAAGAAQQQNH